MIYKVIDNCKDKWIVLIHCVCGNEHVFDLQMSSINKRYNVIVIRLVGHGIEGNINKANMLDVVKEIHTYIIEKGIVKIDILGVSLGAMIANLYIELYPETVNTVYLAGMIYKFSNKILEIMYGLLIKTKQFIPKKMYMFFITYILLPGKDNKAQREKIYNASQNMSTQYLYLWMEEMQKFMKKAKKHFFDILGFDVMYIYGEKDKIFLNYTKRIIKRSEENVKLVVLKNASHLCNISNAYEFNLLIGGKNNETFNHNRC